MAKAKSYEKAYTELQTIIKNLQNEEIGLDDLAKEIKKGSELIKVCREKLKNIEIDIESSLDV